LQFPVSNSGFSITYSAVKPLEQTSATPKQSLSGRLFPVLFGSFLALALLKFGNPPIMEKWVTPPSEFIEFVIFTPWPIAWAYWMLAGVAVVGVFSVFSSRTGPSLKQGGCSKWLLVLPLVWLAWQWLAAMDSVDWHLSKATLLHFAACVLCFYLGFFALSRARQPWTFWLPLLAGFVLVLAIGWDQHLGGLETSRKYFKAYLYKEEAHLPPEFIKKMQSDRIFSTLFYPNALAGGLLLLLPTMLIVARRWPEALASKRVRLGCFAVAAMGGLCFLEFGSKGAGFFLLLVAVALVLPRWRSWLAGVLVVGSLACLFWSGSKGGWLLMLLLGVITLLRFRVPKKLKLMVIAGVILLSLAGFFWKYSAFFQKGATSVVARFDYWRAALQITRQHPFLGTGPGTFAIPYAEIKKPEAEMSRMVHNDYLEQASDSGLVGFLAYLGFIWAALILSYFTTCESSESHPSRSEPQENVGIHPSPNWLLFLIWLGVLGWALQGFVEFCLFIPGLAWPAFSLLGCVLAHRVQSKWLAVDKA